MDLLKENWAAIRNCQYEIEAVCGEKEIDFQRVQMDILQDSYTITRTELQDILDVLEPPQPIPETVRGRGDPANNPVTTQALLPRIEVPKFDGNVLKWKGFHNLFRALIHSKTHIRGSEKLHYLKTSVEGEAAQVIGSFELTDENYLEAWQLLEERYDNRRLTVHAHIENMFNHPDVIKGSVVSIRSLNALQRCLRISGIRYLCMS